MANVLPHSCSCEKARAFDELVDFCLEREVEFAERSLRYSKIANCQAAAGTMRTFSWTMSYVLEKARILSRNQRTPFWSRVKRNFFGEKEAKA